MRGEEKARESGVSEITYKDGGIITQSLQNVKLSIYLYIYRYKRRQKLILEDNGAELEEEVSHSIKIWSNLIIKSIRWDNKWDIINGME